MKKVISSPGSATIVNAIATGFGSAFGIDLNIICKAKTINNTIKCSTESKNTNTDLIKISASNVFKEYGINSNDFGVSLDIKSILPVSSGLSSSSAISNGVTAVVSKIISEEFNLKPLNDFEVINLAIDSSLEANVTITGAFDDATASYFGGVTLTDNFKREIIFKETMEEYKVLVFLPENVFKAKDIDFEKMKIIYPLINIAFEVAKSKDYFKALTLNGLIYGLNLGFDLEIAFEALKNGALASGLSGTGPSFIAISNNENIDKIKDVWSLFNGKILETKVNNIGCKFI